MMSTMTLKVPHGFTIVELIVVVAVIGLLVAIGSVSYNGIRQSASDKSLLSDIDAVESELARYAVKNGGSYGTELSWNSASGSNANIRFMPSSGNVVVVTATASDYCIKAYNPASNKKTLSTAAQKGLRSTSC